MHGVWGRVVALAEACELGDSGEEIVHESSVSSVNYVVSAPPSTLCISRKGFIQQDSRGEEGEVI